MNGRPTSLCQHRNFRAPTHRAQPQPPHTRSRRTPGTVEARHSPVPLPFPRRAPTLAIAKRKHPWSLAKSAGPRLERCPIPAPVLPAFLETPSALHPSASGSPALAEGLVRLPLPARLRDRERLENLREPIRTPASPCSARLRARSLTWTEPNSRS